MRARRLHDDSGGDSLGAEPSPPLPPRGHGRRATAVARASERCSSPSTSEPRQRKTDAAEKTESREESDADDHVIQVAVRCRPRKRPRHERHTASRAGLRRSREWLSRATRSDESDDSDRSSSASSDRDFGSTGVLEFSSDRHQRSGKRSLHASPLQQKPSLLAQTQSGGAKRRFEFDFVFPPSAHQRDVYDGSVRQQIAHVLRAHELSRPPTHATIVAYGQTGTGKTYTMGMLTSVHDEAERGIIPRAVAQVMEYVESCNNQLLEGDTDKCVVVSVSYLQIYLEMIQDLLVFPVDSGGGGQFASSASADRYHQQRNHHRRRTPNSSDLQVRQRQNQAFYVEGLNEYEVASVDDVHVLLETAAQNRILASTARNKTSSRSHTLLTIALKRSSRRGRRRQSAASSDVSDSSSSSNDESRGGIEDDSDAYSISFVDLAGSERVDGALHFLNATRRRQELRIREAKFINRSLSALGSVIAALAQPRQHRGAKTPTSLAATLAHLKRTGKAPPTSQQQQQQSAQPPRHIRFRDSQLTKLLQSRLLSGRGRLVLIATIDDQRANLTETLSTLKFASQCRRVELRSPRSRAARRKNSLLEQVFQEMKTTYEEREAALRREYQSRIDALEAQLHAAESDAASRWSAAYSALCALADRTLLAPGEQHRHPEATSFGSKEDVVSYVTALYSCVQAALKSPALLPEPARADASPHQLACGRSESGEKKAARERRPSRTLAPPKGLSHSLMPAADLSNASKVTSARVAEDAPMAQLSPADEDAFKSVARLLLSSPEMLAAYHVAPDLDVSFSQIDAAQ